MAKDAGQRRFRLKGTYRNAATVLAAAAIFAAGTWWGDFSAHRGDQWGPERLLSTAIDSVRANALDALPTDELLRRAVSGMLRELRDPYAALLKPDGARQYRGTLQGEGQGLGLVMRREDSRVLVARVMAGSPAAVAGVRAGDRVLSVDGVPVAEGWGRKASDSVRTVHDDTSRMVLFRPPVGDTVRVTLARGRWHMTAVTEVALLGDHVGYAYLSTVSAKASDELERAVDQLQQRGATSLVLDLRGNGGGLFEEGVRVASLFLPRGVVVASLAGRGTAPNQDHRARRSRWPDMPITVLVDARTASAAEVIAAALHDHGRALLVGEPTYGKGLVQRVVSLTPELSLRLTTARWLTPKGISLERRQGLGADAHGGLIPDIIVSDANRRDAMATPASLTVLASARLLRLADSAAAHALREGWASSDVSTNVSLLEGRLHASIDQQLPSGQGIRRASLVAEATRLATTRVLQLRANDEELMRYTSSTDAALRAALEVVAPGQQPARVDIAIASAAASESGITARRQVVATNRGSDARQ